MYPNVHCSNIYNSQAWNQPKYPVTDEQIKKMWYLYTMEYYSAIERNEIESFAMRWMDLESVIHSEVSQKEKNKYQKLMRIYGIQKNGTDEPSGREGIETQTQRMDLTHASRKLLCSIGRSTWCFVTTQRGGMGRVGGRPKREVIQVYIQLIQFVVQQKLTQHCKAIII